MIQCRVSPGEYLDKYSILLIKKAFFADPKKLSDVEEELTWFTHEVIHQCGDLLGQLKGVNMQLWLCNDSRKLAIKEARFDDDFVAASVLESRLNDERNRIKNQINLFFGSILEHKSYL